MCIKDNLIIQTMGPHEKIQSVMKQTLKKIDGPLSLPKISDSKGGGCLIATATYGSEMAVEVQQLRELRDNTLLNTESGTQFMKSFNNVYYSFSPVIADYERENPLFKEAVKLAITPLISSLSILNYVDMNSESEVLGYGISLIILNLGMYLGVPAVVIVGIKKKF
jgi:peptidyl-prolyl cis-trans isomerase B (cyclophilin B)